MHVSHRWLLALCMLAACNTRGRKPEADTSGTSPVSQEMHGGDLYFESDTLRAASSPGRVIGLILHGTGDAEMSTDYLNYFPEMMQAGPWQEHGDTISMTLKALDQRHPTAENLTFLQAHHKLTYIGNGYGSEGLVLTEKPRPAARPRLIDLWVAPQKITCTDVKGNSRPCLQIAFSKVVPGADADWAPLSEDIKGFTFQPGKLQHLKVLRTPRRGQLQDERSYSYALQETLPNK